MRKWVWYACLIAVLATADMIGSAFYVYKHPDSLLGRCAVASMSLSARFNPFLYGMQTVSDSFSTMMRRGDEGVAPAESASFERPEEPAAVEEAEVVEPAAQEEAQGAWVLPQAWGHIVIEEEDNAADQPADEHGWFSSFFQNTQEPPLVDVELPWGVVVGSTIDPMSPLDADCEHDCGHCCWFMKAVEDCMTAVKAVSDAHFLRYWFSCFSSPSMLDNKGDAETSEPKDDAKPDESQEDPYQSYHHSDCPYSGVCPYSGKMPSVEPSVPEEGPVPTEPTEPMKLPKIKMKPPKLDDGEQSETPTYRPDIDTMEFRDSDRTWDDYGDPMQL